MPETADAIIIGAGIHGASLAFHLSLRGLRPLVLERRFIAAGATGRSSGLVRMHYDLEPESALAWASFRIFHEWKNIVGGDCGFTRTGFVQIVDPAAEDRLQANVAMHQRLGIPSLLVTADDVRRLAPSFRTDDFAVAAFEPESGYADPTASASGFLEAARGRGARLVQEARVQSIRIAGGRIVGVDTTQGAFDAPIIVNTAGAWAAEIGHMTGVDLPVTTWRHDTAFFVRPPELGPSHPTVIDFIHSMYFRPETGGLTLVGLEDGNPIGLSPEGDSGRAQPGFVERAIDRICRRIPAMEGGSLHSANGGFDGITPDQRAILDQVGPEGFFVACGFSGTGFKIGPAVGACMSERILDGRATTVDITPFRFARFAEGKPLSGEHAYESIWR
ncbi:MAG TPA: FAD-dependent oxidoreductase [Anaerolineales bacterium]|nr:FAD-dependent oxidoreductase [Anaerolineales bacterium]